MRRQQRRAGIKPLTQYELLEQRQMAVEELARQVEDMEQEQIRMENLQRAEQATSTMMPVYQPTRSPPAHAMSRPASATDSSTGGGLFSMLYTLRKQMLPSWQPKPRGHHVATGGSAAAHESSDSDSDSDEE